MNSINNFGQALRKRAHWTHNIIKRSTMLRLGIMEETITDMLLFSIADEFSANTITRKSSRREEGAKSGVDWLWIVGKPGSWLPLLIQAKITNLKTENCQHFDYKNSEQRKRLLAHARQYGYVSIYCVYSCIPSDFSPPEQLDYNGFKKEYWACSLVSPKAVRYLSNQGIKNQKEILKYCIHWMAPFLMRASGKDPVGQSVAKAIVDIRDTLTSSNIKRSEVVASDRNSPAKSHRISWESLDTAQAIKEEIPKNIQRLFKDTSLKNNCYIVVDFSEVWA